MATIGMTNPSVYFECPVCMEDIDDSWKMLPCQHVFCLGCLRSLYEADPNQNPQCPTCREEVAVSLERLQKPRLLYEMYENWRASNRNRGVTDDTERDLIAAAELQSIDDLRRIQEEEAKENEHLEIALCKSAEEAAQKMEMESLLCVAEADFIAAIQLSIRENAKRSNDVDETGGRAQPLTTNVPVNFGLSDFNDYLKANGNAVLSTILAVISNEEELNSMESTEIVSYLKTIDRYLNTLKNFRRQQIDKIIQDFGETDERLTRILTSENRDDDDGEKTGASCNNEEDNLINLVKALELERKDDALLKVTLKKSEVLDPIDTLRRQFVGIKKKLQNTLLNVIMNSESGFQTAAPPSDHVSSAVASSRSLILPLPHSSSPCPRLPSPSHSSILPLSQSSAPITSNRSLIQPLFRNRPLAPVTGKHSLILPLPHSSSPCPRLPSPSHSSILPLSQSSAPITSNRSLILPPFRPLAPVNDKRSLILPLPSNSIRPSSSSSSNHRGRNNNVSYQNTQSVRNNYRGSRGDRGGIHHNVAYGFNGNRGGYNKGRGGFNKYLGGWSRNNGGRGDFNKYLGGRSRNNGGRGDFNKNLGGQSSNNQGRSGLKRGRGDFNKIPRSPGGQWTYFM